eukprot:4328557-Karenia_brevis.AAC.1
MTRRETSRIPRCNVPLVTQQFAVKSTFNHYEESRAKNISSRWQKQTGAQRSWKDTWIKTGARRNLLS